MRVVSLLPAATEIACALGLAEDIVGVSQDCDYPREIRDRPRLTSSHLAANASSAEIHEQVCRRVAHGEAVYRIDAERLAALAPDLVLTQRQCSLCAPGESDTVRALARVGSQARVLALEARRFHQMLDDIRRVGRVCGRARQAEELIEQLSERLQWVGRKSSAAERLRVFCLSWFSPLMAAGHWVTEMVEFAGGEDGLGARGQISTRLEPARLEAYAPEVILLLPCGFTRRRTQAEWEAIRHLPPWRDLPATRRGKVFAVPGSLFHRPGPRLVEGVELLASLLHSRRRAAPDPGASAQGVS